ncbi:MAG TPA: TssN family type VI secretion system protein [Cryomorphaceae bacterium]|nr:TssN family type VI secretion system protein [Cryomorphaceae bacterium]
MRSIVIVVWSVFFIISAASLVFLLKKRKRKMAKLDYLFPVIYGFAGLGLGYLFFMDWLSELHQIWTSRLVFLVLGIAQTTVLMKRDWTIRDRFLYHKDSILPEMLYTFSLAFLTAGLFIMGGTYSLVNQSIYTDPSIGYWDLPLLFVLPFFWQKLFDMAGQRPQKTIAQQWAFPLEKVSAQNWPWRDLVTVNFQMKRSLLDEYNIFADEAKPWIEAPSEISLGAIFQLCLQERRGNKNLVTIQDLGDEYDGDPQFFWMFLRKTIWYKPNTWKKRTRLLDPQLSVKANKIDPDDIIVARRVSGHGLSTIFAEDEPNMDEDSNKTVIIKR